MRRHLALLAALSLWIAPSPIPAAAMPPGSEKSDASGEGPKTGERVEWLAFDAATARAKNEKKHLIVDIYTTWCGWCRVMEKETYGNPEVAAYLRENFVLAKVNGESSAKLRWRGKEMTERQLARTVGVTGYPATYFFKPDAELLGGMGGFLRPPEFMIYARYISTRWYEKGKISAYVDSLRNAGQ
jgi:thioredoxin-related protein